MQWHEIKAWAENRGLVFLDHTHFLCSKIRGNKLLKELGLIAPRREFEVSFVLDDKTKGFVRHPQTNDEGKGWVVYFYSSLLD